MQRRPKRGGQFAIIWVDLLYEDSVPQSAKILYGEIYRLSDADGYCDASNKDFMDLLGCSETTVRNLLKSLVDVGQIRIESVPRRTGSGGTDRRIFCARKLAPPSEKRVPAKNCGYPEKQGEGTRRNLRGVPAENCGSTYSSNLKNNNTLYPCKQEIFDEAISAIQSIVADDGSNAAQDAVCAALEEQGFLCQRRVAVESRDGHSDHAGRLAVVATKADIVIGIQVDRKTPREKSLYKLRDYPCDYRVVVLREESPQPLPAGIDAVVFLKTARDELFERFWNAYPKKKAKVDARNAWNRLAPDMDLCWKMSAALTQQKQSEDWKREAGRFIPYPATWLNQRRWEDADTLDAPDEPAEAGEERKEEFGWR